MGTIRESFAGEKVSLVKGVIPPQCGGNVRVSGQKGTAAVSGGAAYGSALPVPFFEE